MIVRDLTAAAIDEVDALGAIHGASASEPDEEVGLKLPGNLQALADMGRGRVLLNSIVEFDGQSRRADGVHSKLGVARGNHAAVGNDKHPAASVFHRQLAELEQAAWAGGYACR